MSTTSDAQFKRYGTIGKTLIQTTVSKKTSLYPKGRINRMYNTNGKWSNLRPNSIPGPRITTKPQPRLYTNKLRGNWARTDFLKPGKQGSSRTTLDIGKPKQKIKVAYGGYKQPDQLKGGVKSSFKRFRKKSPANSKQSISIYKSSQNKYEFQAISPAKNGNGSKAIYKKIVSPEGKKIKMSKMTIDREGRIVHVKNK